MIHKIMSQSLGSCVTLTGCFLVSMQPCQASGTFFALEEGRGGGNIGRDIRGGATKNSQSVAVERIEAVFDRPKVRRLNESFFA